MSERNQNGSHFFSPPLQNISPGNQLPSFGQFHALHTKHLVQTFAEGPTDDGEVVMAAYPENNPFCRGKSQPAPVVFGNQDSSFESAIIIGEPEDKGPF